MLRGVAPDALLDSYHIERHAAAMENLSLTEATIQFMVPPTGPKRLFRKAILAASLVAVDAPVRQQRHDGHSAQYTAARRS